jgi:hypothetical protein
VGLRNLEALGRRRDYSSFDKPLFYCFRVLLWGRGAESVAKTGKERSIGDPYRPPPGVFAGCPFYETSGTPLRRKTPDKLVESRRSIF